MEWISILYGTAGSMVSVCAIAAALDLLIQEDSAAFGFRMACRLCITLTVLRGIIELIG